MKLFKYLKLKLVENIATAIIGIISLPFGMLVHSLINAISVAILVVLPKKTLLDMLGTTILLIIFLLALIAHLYFKYRTNFTFKYNVLWDKTKTPYCVKCKIPLVHNHHVYKPTNNIQKNDRVEENLACSSCRNTYYLKRINGSSISYEEVKSLL